MKHILMIHALQNISSKFLKLTALLSVCSLTLLRGNDHLNTTEPLPCLGHWHATDYFFDFCDTCGCGSTGGSMGYGTGLNTNFMGVRYIGQQYRSRDGIFNDSPWINESFNTLQAWGNFSISKRVVVNVIIPYQFHYRKLPDATEQHINGLGDLSVLAFYNLIAVQPDSIVSIKPKHYLQVGGGLKLPTGAYEKANNEGSVNPSFQLGNGSWDYIAGLNYGFTYRNWGISSMVNYTIKTENSKSYQFGNQLNYGLNAFKTYYVSNQLALTPVVGIAGENYAANKEFALEVAHTKGEIFLGRLSVEATLNKYSLGVVSMLPIAQNLNGGKVELKNRLSVYLNVNF